MPLRPKSALYYSLEPRKALLSKQYMRIDLAFQDYDEVTGFSATRLNFQVFNPLFHTRAGIDNHWDD